MNASVTTTSSISCRREQVEDVLHARLADDRNHRLRLVRGQRPEPRPLPTRHDDGLHRRTSRRAFATYCAGRDHREREANPEERERPPGVALGDEHERERRVEAPGRDLPEAGDLEVVAARHDELVAADQEQVAERGSRARSTGAGRDDEQHDGDVDHQPVGERVGDLPELGLDAPAAREPAVELVGDRGDARRRSPRASSGRPVARASSDDEDRDRREPQDRQRVRQLAKRRGDRRARLTARRLVSSPWRERPRFPASSTPTATRSSARSAGRARRRRLLGVARGDARARPSARRPATVRELYAPHVPRDARRRDTPRSASSTTSGSRRPSRLPRRPTRRASAFVLPPRRVRARWARAHAAAAPSPPTSARSRRSATAGIAVGVAPHSVRACPRDWLEELGRYAAGEGLVLHVHADEQPREIEECLAEHGVPPDRAARRLPAASASERPSFTRRTRTAASSTCSATRARDLRVPDDRGGPRRRLPARRSACGTAGSRSASARTRTSGSTRSRSCASSRGSRGGRAAAAASSRPTSCGRSAARTAPRRSGSTSWAEIEVDLDHPSLARRRRRRTSARRSSRAAARTSSWTPDAATAATLASMDVTELDLRRGRPRALARGAGRRRLLGRVVRPVPRARAGARGRGRGARRRGRARQGRRRREPRARRAVRRQRDPGGQGVSRRQGREGVRRRAVAHVRLRLPRRAVLAPPRADALVEELRASGELPEVVAGARRGRRRARARPASSTRCPRPSRRSGSGCARSPWRCSSGSARTTRSSRPTGADSRPRSTEPRRTTPAEPRRPSTPCGRGTRSAPCVP